MHLVDDATDSFFTELSVFHFQYKPKNYSKQIFAFTDQNQQHLVLNLNLKPCEQWKSILMLKEKVNLVDVDADAFFIELSVFHFSIQT